MKAICKWISFFRIIRASFEGDSDEGAGAVPRKDSEQKSGGGSFGSTTSSEAMESSDSSVIEPVRTISERWEQLYDEARQGVEHQREFRRNLPIEQTPIKAILFKHIDNFTETIDW